MFKVTAKPDVDPAVNAFREARRELGRRTREGLIAAGEEAAVPAARRSVGSLAVAGRSVAPTLVARGTRSDAYVTTKMRGKLGRAVGLLEFGGTVRTPIRPRKKKALVIAGKFVRENVTKHRKYEPGMKITSGVEGAQPKIAEVVERELLKAYRAFNAGI